MRRIGLLFAMVGLLGSCGLNETRYNKKVAKAYCKWEERCDSADFYANFDTVGACADAQEAQLTKLDAYYAASCVFNKDQARDCLKALDTGCQKSAVEFNELFAPCYAVWDCAQDFTPATDTADFL